jgi:FkbM family methyltransferase
MKLRDLRYLRFNSAWARRVLGLFYRPHGVYRVWFGPLRGLRLRYNPSVNFHAILGFWDPDVFVLLDRVLLETGLLPKDSVAADIGGNIGYYTMWLSRVAVTLGRVYTFEPSPDPLRLLKDNLSLNAIRNVEVIAEACGDHVGTTDFFLANHHHSSSLHEEWAQGLQSSAQKITVPMTTLDAFFAPETNRKPPSFMKIDIEGGGTHALPGCRRIFAETRPFVLIESHTPKEDGAIADVLCNFNYRAFRLNDEKWVQRPEMTHPDIEGVWGTLLLVPDEHYAQVFAVVGRT